MNESLGQRLQRLRNAAGKSQAALAKLCGWSSQSRVGNYESGTREPTLGDIELMAKALGVPYGVLLIGEDFEASKAQIPEPSNVAMIAQPEQMYRYPVVSWVTAGTWSEAVQPFPDGFSDRYDISDYKAKGPAFWLEVKGDSMTSTSAPSIPEGSQILVDTEADVRPGKLVIAKLADSNEATFKKLVEDGGVRYLKPLNPAYPTVQCSDDCKIIGVVVRSLTKFA
ncbi:sulfurtransferase [Pseudomonas syringae]|uniref:Phage repressor protein. Serine peptidase. MEROPS family S24 n=1 Tax=Pseudomonas syringae TaxID=317 RepID=A0AB37ZPT3_PSESX|nr:LexA family transcriptional regulator [Pseudomonas syringae]MDU8420255.1 LexA family transcriptional regulator [Pseudomonas syringae]RXT72276.1 sulfurtransferase [Pseudomonas syringae]RXT85310.1 sulfurtransferase [Pseudomonas syringae]SDN48352.1 phage repressor protein. Serine peptidase. MEROPS family S24 [Pseudomonas syringae]